MDRPPLEVADLVRAAGQAFIERSRKWRGAQTRLPERPAQLLWRLEAPRSAQNLCRLATASVPTRLGGVLETPLRWPRICSPISGPLHSSRSHLQPPTGLFRRPKSHLSLA